MAMTKIVTTQEYSKILKDNMIRRFKDCMRRQFSERITTHGGLTDLELRNVVRTFCMGWSEALASQGDVTACHCWALAVGDITTEHWWPGDEWRFW